MVPRRGREAKGLGIPGIGFDSYRLHQIQPFGGACARISATVHVARERDGFEAWF